MDWSSNQPDAVTGKMWLTARFVVFGMTGVALFFFGWFASWLSCLDSPVDFLKVVFVYLPCIGVGLVLAVYGVGKWREKAYATVFVSMPVSLVVMGWFLKGAGDGGGQPVAFLFLLFIFVQLVAGLATNACVKNYYRNKAAREFFQREQAK